VAAIAAYFRDVLIIRIPAVVAAVFLVAAHRTSTSVMLTSVIVRHNLSPKFAPNFAFRREIFQAKYSLAPVVNR
jgi:hypothetical protein